MNHFDADQQILVLILAVIILGTVLGRMLTGG
jgi:hypothetical protein